MVIRFLSALALIAATLGCTAQGPIKLGFQLQAWLAKAEQQQPVDLFLGGEAEAVSRAVARLGGRVKMTLPDWVQAELPAGQVPALNGEEAVRCVVFSLSKGHALNDSMRVKAWVEEARAGMAPLLQGFDGEGVLVGIIDTGIELSHPDFRDTTGRTRVLHYWDQNYVADPEWTPAEFGYGQAWDSTAINAGLCPANDLPSQYGHGTTVAATAAANSNGNGHCEGVAPNSDLIIVSNKMGGPNWSSGVVDAVRYILDRAAELERSVAINLSLGDYYGSHDGLDPAALMIDQMLNAAPGRVLVCAAGNSGNLPAYHLRTEVGADTSFTWFGYNPYSALGMAAVYFDLWADTADFSQVRFSVGANRPSGSYAQRGQLPFRDIQSCLGQEVVDTLWSFSGNRLGTVHTLAQLRGGQYHLEVFLPEPDSASLRFSFSTTGQGRFDAWSSDIFGTSKMITAIPDSATWPPIARYVMPDNEQCIVDSWACSANVITVGNFYNQQVYTDISGVVRDLGQTPGAISVNSSRGPSRTGLLKPDVSAPADVTFGAGPYFMLDMLLAQGQEKLIDSLHMRNGGTSIASPVVAGTAALLLQKCPRATHAEVRDAIVASAMADSFTGAVPNISYGHGKVSAYGALVAAGPAIPFALSGPLCTGDSVLVDGPAGMAHYAWSTGDTLPAVWSAGGALQLWVEGMNGCQARSDTLFLQPQPLPVPVIAVDGVQLASSPAASYQWYFEGSAIDGATGQEYTAEVNGAYAVEVTDSAGCTGRSADVLVLSVGVGTPAQGPYALWPSPVQDVLHISGPGLVAGGRYEINDATGRMVGQGTWTAGAGITVQGLPAGAYLLRFPGGTMPGFRFVKQ